MNSRTSSFDQAVLMLISHTTTHYHRRVSIWEGSQIIDQMTNCITKEELKPLSQSWKLAHVSTIISKSSQVSEQEFDLDQVKVKVGITKKVIAIAFQTVIAGGLTKVTGHQKTCPCAGGTTSEMQKYIHSRESCKIDTRGIRGSRSTSKFIWEIHCFRASH